MTRGGAQEQGEASEEGTCEKGRGRGRGRHQRRGSVRREGGGAKEGKGRRRAWAITEVLASNILRKTVDLGELPLLPTLYNVKLSNQVFDT